MSRPCNSYSRSKDRWTRDELVKLALNKGYSEKDVKNKNINVLCTELGLSTSAKRTSAKRTSAKRKSAKRTSAKRTSAKRTSAKRTSAKRKSANRTSAKRKSANRTSAKRTSANRTSAKRKSANRTSAKRTSAKRKSAKRTSAKRKSANRKSANRTSAKRKSANRTSAKRTSSYNNIFNLLNNNDVLDSDIIDIITAGGNEGIITHIYYNAIKNNNNKVIRHIENIYKNNFEGTITLTFGDVAESHVGMQKIGKMAKEGFKLEDLIRAQDYFNKKGCETFIIHLNNYLPEEDATMDHAEKTSLQEAKTNPAYQAYVLVARNGLRCLTGDSEGKHVMTEALIFPWDTKLYNERRKIVQNKTARYNLNWSDQSQQSDFSKGLGTTISWDDSPLISDIRNGLVSAFGPAAKDLKCEGNKYYNPKGTGIGPHGDSERRKVIGVRLGRTMNIFWQWYYNDLPKGVAMSMQLNPGDIYCMSEKTVGTDWRPKLEMGWHKKRYVLRHSAGAEKYTTNTGKLKLSNPRPDNNNIGKVTIWDMNRIVRAKRT